MAKKSDGVTDEQVGEDVSMGSADDPGRLLPVSLRFEWTDEERETIETIRHIVKQEVASEFKQATHALHVLLAKVRTQAEMDDEPAFDEQGLPVWETWPDGTVKEDWSRIDAVDIDQFIMNASVFSFFAGQSVVDSYGEAVFAKYMSEDAFAEAYASMHKGTISDKDAAAKRKTRQERYFAFYCAYKHKYMKELLDRMDNITRKLEFVRKSQIDDRWRTSAVSGQRP